MVIFWIALIIVTLVTVVTIVSTKEHFTDYFKYKIEPLTKKQEQLDWVANVAANKVTDNSDDCRTFAHKICSFTHPNMYISEYAYLPPRWNMQTYKNVNVPTQTFLPCYQTVYNCCKTRNSVRIP